MLSEVLSLVGQTEGKHLYDRGRDSSFPQSDNLLGQPNFLIKFMGAG